MVKQNFVGIYNKFLFLTFFSGGVIVP